MKLKFESLAPNYGREQHSALLSIPSPPLQMPTRPPVHASQNDGLRAPTNDTHSTASHGLSLAWTKRVGPTDGWDGRPRPG